MTKLELIQRLKRSIQDLRKITLQSKFLGEETADLEYEIDCVERELAKLIDDYMAAQFARHNRRR